VRAAHKAKLFRGRKYAGQSLGHNSHANFGFILAGPILDFPSSLPKDNNGNVTWYNDLQLQVIYNPAQNPRAPQ